MKNIVILFLILPTLLFSQSWEKTFGKGYGFSAQQTMDGGYIITGSQQTETNIYNAVLIKTDELGDTLWTKTFDKTSNSCGYSVQQTTDLGYILTGKTDKDTKSLDDLLLIKTDEFGDTLWRKTYGTTGQEYGHSVKQTSDGGYIVCGFSNFNYHLYLYLLKTDTYGDTLWTKTYGGNCSGRSVKQTEDGGYIVVGSIRSTSSRGQDVYLVKTDSYGDTLWTRTYDEQYTDKGYSVQQTIDGGYIISGSTNEVGNRDVYLCKTNIDGEVLWSKTYGGDRHDEGLSVQQTLNGGYIINGYTQKSQEDFDMYMIRTDEIGDTVWTKTFGGEYEDSGHSVQQTTDGGFILSGFYESNSGNNVYVIKTDGDGIVSTPEILFDNPTRKLIKIVDFSGREIRKLLKNVPFIEIYDDGTSQKKIILK